MSEYSMITTDPGLGWPVAFGASVIGAVAIGWDTYLATRWLDWRTARRSQTHLARRP